ncbi:unnamed protein product, partial [Amoebophrya sp. A25]
DKDACEVATAYVVAGEERLRLFVSDVVLSSSLEPPALRFWTFFEQLFPSAVLLGAGDQSMLEIIEEWTTTMHSTWLGVPATRENESEDLSRTSSWHAFGMSSELAALPEFLHPTLINHVAALVWLWLSSVSPWLAFSSSSAGEREERVVGILDSDATASIVEDVRMPGIGEKDHEILFLSYANQSSFVDMTLSQRSEDDKAAEKAGKAKQNKFQQCMTGKAAPGSTISTKRGQTVFKFDALCNALDSEAHCLSELDKDAAHSQVSAEALASIKAQAMQIYAYRFDVEKTAQGAVQRYSSVDTSMRRLFSPVKDRTMDVSRFWLQKERELFYFCQGEALRFGVEGNTYSKSSQPALPSFGDTLSVAHIRQEQFGNCYIYGVLQVFARLGWLREIKPSSIGVYRVRLFLQGAFR